MIRPHSQYQLTEATVWLRAKSESMMPREVEKQASGAAGPVRVLSIRKSRERENKKGVEATNTHACPQWGASSSKILYLKIPRLPQPASPTGNQVFKHRSLWETFLYASISSLPGSLPWLSEIWALREFAKPSVKSNHSSGNKQEAEKQMGLQGTEQWHLQCNSE